MIKAFLQWFDSVSPVGIEIYLTIFKYMVLSGISTYILWKNPGYFKKVVEESRTETANKKASQKIGDGLITIAGAISFCIFGLSVTALVLFILIAITV